MTTDNGAIKSKAEYGKVNTVMYTRYLIGWGALFLVAVGGLIAEIVAAVLKSDWYSTLILVCCCLVIASSGYLVGIYSYMIIKSRKDGKWNEAECYADCVKFTAYSGEGKIGEETVYYDKLVKHVEYKDFFAIYNNIAVTYAIGKDGLSDEEVNTLRAILKLRVREGGSAPMPPTLSESGKAKEAVADKSAENVVEPVSETVSEDTESEVAVGAETADKEGKEE